jgi:hypothetical protein
MKGRIEGISISSIGGQEDRNSKRLQVGGRGEDSLIYKLIPSLA